MHKNLCLDVRDLKKTYGYHKVVDGLSFQIAQGEIVGLLGPNGAGKTTAFYMTMGLIRADQGQVFFQGTDVTSLPIHRRAQLGMGYLAQEPSIFRALSVEDNLLCVLESLPLSHKARKSRLEELLAELRLTALAKKMAGALSGGERRRLEITRALISKPTLLLLDEPFANIDPISVQELKQLITLLAQKGISVLITDHNAREIFSVVQRSYLIYEGKALLCGTPEELLQNEVAKNCYFGTEFRM